MPKLDYSRPSTIIGLVLLAAFAAFTLYEIATDGDIWAATTLKALALGAVYAMIALGFVLIFKATEVVNFSQGALAMIGALFISFMVADENLPLIPFYTTWPNPLYNIGLPDSMAWFLSVLVALCFCGALGLFLERIAIRPMIGEPLFSVAVITLGLEISLRALANDAVKIEFRSTNAPWGTDGFLIGDGFVNYSFFAAMIAAAISFAAVLVFFRTRTGIAMRAVAYDQEAAMAQGINIGRIFAIAWGAGAVLAALGGLDSVQGALVGGLLIGLAEIYAGQYLSGYTDVLGPGYPLIVPYVVMIVVLLVRPYGLYGTPEIRRV